MRKFIPLSTFKSLYSTQADLLSSDGMMEFREKLLVNGNETALQNGFTTEDFIAFQETLNDPSSIVFYGWIEQQSPLLDALLGKKLSLFVDNARHLEHSLSKKFQRFLSPVLSDRLIRLNPSTDSERKTAFSFTQLLDDDHRAVVENRLFQPWQEQLNQLKIRTESVLNEQELVNLVKPLCSDTIIDSLNYLSRASYSIKLGYVDRILDVIHSKPCTVRFANWILERMSLVVLNNEHHYKITDLQKELRRGNLTVTNHKQGRTPIRWKAVLSATFIALIIGCVIWIVAFQPFSKVEPPEFSNNTSFREFSREERIRMDSLLREMDHPFEKSDSLDPMLTPVQLGVDIDLELRKAFTNERMESIYDDLISDVELKTNHPSDSCITSKNSPYKNPPGVGPLSAKKGVHEAVIRNESDFDIIVYVSENAKNGEIHGAMVRPNQTLEFKINKFNMILIIAGNQFQKFHAPSGAKSEELPSDLFTHHFCDTDLNYEETINSTYQFIHPREGKNKFMVMGAKSGYVHLVDIHKILEVY